MRVGSTDSTLSPEALGPGGHVDLAANTIDQRASQRFNAQPWTMTSPVFVDRGGDGRPR